jgi:hypothetical protein
MVAKGLVFFGGLAQKLSMLLEKITSPFRVESRVCGSGQDTLLALLTFAPVAGGRCGNVDHASSMVQRKLQC